MQTPSSLAAVLTAVSALLVAPSGASAKGGEIPAGAHISPPKKASFIADREGERSWFERLHKITAADLQPGDVLLRKYYHGNDHPVVLGQTTFKAEHGSKYTTHAMLYVGDGKIAHAAGGSFLRVVITDLANYNINIIAWRPTDPQQAKSAVETARWMAGHHIPYSSQHCLGTAVHDSGWGEQAKARAAEVASRKLPETAMMCSEFVTYSFQGAKDAYIHLDARHTAPMKLENYLNSHHDKFKFVGAMQIQGKESSDILDMVERALHKK